MRRLLTGRAAAALRLLGRGLAALPRRGADAALQQRFQTLVEATASIIWTNSPEGEMCGEQASWAAYTGQSPQQYLGYGWAEAIHPDDREPTVRTWQAAVAVSGVCQMEHRVRGRDGRYRHFAVHAVPLRDAHGKIREWMGTHSDITAQKAANERLAAAHAELQRKHLEAKQSEEKFRSVTDSANDAIVAADAMGVVLSWNRGAGKLFGYSAEDMVGRKLTTLMPEALRQAHEDGMAHMRRTGHGKLIGRSVEVQGRKACGSVFPLELSLATWTMGEERYFTGILRDLTAAKARAAKEHTQLLELRAAKEAAEVANRAKSAFLANMSHEIRTPMNAILGMAELLAETPLDAQQAQYVRLCETSGKHLLHLINDILDLSKMDAGQVELERIPFDLAEVIDKSHAIVAEMFARKNVAWSVTVQPDVPPTLVGDGSRLQQIILNLLGNALKFTDRGRIALSVQRDRQRGGATDLLFEVSDTGIGMPADKLTHIFGSFTQVDASTTRRYGGSGLGLCISQQLVQLMDGKIWAESTLGQGSTFCFTARFGVAAAPVAPPAGRLSGAPLPHFSEPKNILLVEDTDGNRLLIRAYLKATPLRLEEAVDGAEALRKATQIPYDLILMDIQMPVMDGYQATRQIRAMEQQQGRKACPIVALTANAYQEDLQKSLDVGCNAHLIKPVSKRSLLECIATYVQCSATPPTR